jgi:hypothetical protein
MSPIKRKPTPAELSGEGPSTSPVYQPQVASQEAAFWDLEAEQQGDARKHDDNKLLGGSLVVGGEFEALL